MSDAPDQPSPTNGTIKKIVYPLFLIMLVAIIGVIWVRLDRIDATQQTRGERVRSLEERMDGSERRVLEDKLRVDRLYEELYKESRRR